MMMCVPCHRNEHQVRSFFIEVCVQDSLGKGNGFFDGAAGVFTEVIVNMHNHICFVHAVYSSNSVVITSGEAFIWSLFTFLPCSLQWLER